MVAPRVFLSYAREDTWWVRLFQHYFDLGNVVFVDYHAKSVGLDELKAAMDEQFAVVVVAFVSKRYMQQKGTVAEWEKSLSEKDRRCLIFVPVVLDADAIESRLPIYRFYR
jgi:hypothetical protein